MGRLARMDRLSIRLAAGITILVVGLLALGLSALSAHHSSRMIEERKRAAELQNRLLEVMLRHQMLQKDKEFIAASLVEVGTQPDVRRAMILDHEGVVHFSSDPRRVGEVIPRDSETCVVCHRKDPDQRERWVLLSSAEGSTLRSVQPIENRPECYECHDPQKKMNGMLLLDVSLDGVEAALSQDRGWMMAGTAMLALLLLGSIGLFVRRLILVRLARLGQAARSIAAGNLGERVPVGGADTIARLGTDFNQMADAVASLVTEVKEHEARLADIMNSLDDGLVVLDRDFRVVASNHAFTRRLGLLPEVLRGRRCREAVGDRHPCGKEGVPCPSAGCFASGYVQRATFHLPERDGRPERVEEVYSSPVFDNDGNVTQVVEVWRDISERFQEESRLVELERLESLGMLASGFSHEMNTPLASTLTCAEAILARLREGGDPADFQDLADTIRKEVLRCRRITEQFLRFARGIPPSTEPVDLPAVVDSVLPLVRLAAREAGATLEMEAHDAIPMVTANTEVVQHVVLNLVMNALQSFEVSGGRVSVGFRNGKDVRLSVRDTGRGLAEPAQQHLFEPFRTGRKGGTGIGLFLSRQFIRRFGGDIVLADSEPGRGSCFEVVFVRAPGVPA